MITCPNCGYKSIGHYDNSIDKEFEVYSLEAQWAAGREKFLCCPLCGILFKDKGYYTSQDNSDE